MLCSSQNKEDREAALCLLQLKHQTKFTDKDIPSNGLTSPDSSPNNDTYSLENLAESNSNRDGLIERNISMFKKFRIDSSNTPSPTAHYLLPHQQHHQACHCTICRQQHYQPYEIQLPPIQRHAHQTVQTSSADNNSTHLYNLGHPHLGQYGPLCRGDEALHIPRAKDAAVASDHLEERDVEIFRQMKRVVIEAETKDPSYTIVESTGPYSLRSRRSALTGNCPFPPHCSGNKRCLSSSPTENSSRYVTAGTTATPEDMDADCEDNMDEDNYEDNDSLGASNSSGDQEPRRQRIRSRNTGAKEKPRWTIESRRDLLSAVISHKMLDDMATFDWNAIGKRLGRPGKACKDQWRRAVFPKIQKVFQTQNTHSHNLQDVSD